MSPEPTAATYSHFYRTVYRADHQHPVNLALHMLGTLGGLVLVAATAAQFIAPWWVLLFPIVHVVPGLVGHRLFDRDEVVGDLRLTRTDYPLWWFIRANHSMTFAVLTGRWHAQA